MAGRDDRARVEQIVGECFVKAANIILSSRIYQSSRTLPKPQSKQRCWLQFNLEVEEVEGAQEEVQQWRRDTSSPLVLEIYQLPWGPDGSDRAGHSKHATGSSTSHAGSRTLLERWTIQWQQDTRPARPQTSRLEPAAIYKRLVITLRSLFTYVRVLPAFRMYRACKRNRSNLFSLHYRLSKGPLKDGAVSAFSAGSTGKMQQFLFTPVETPYGSCKINVDYQPSSAVTVLEQTTASVAASPNIIPDYVGSRNNLSNVSAQIRSTLSASLHGSRLPSSSPPAMPGGGMVRPAMQPQASPILRRHSWSLNSARSQSLDSQGTSHSGGTVASQATHQQSGPSSRSSSLSSQPPYAHPSLPQVQTRGSKGPSPSAFAPNTPGAAATPPKYPSGSLASRMSQAAVQAASKLYAGQGRGASPSGRGASPSSRGHSPSSSGRTSPARRGGVPMAEEMRTFRPAVHPSTAVPEDKIIEEYTVEESSGGQRLASKPVRIPGCDKDSRRMHSSEDLRLLVYEGQPRPSSRKPGSSKTTAASAPAAPTYFGFSLDTQSRAANQRKPVTPFEAVARAQGQGGEKPAQPDTPPVLQTLPSLGSESSSSSSFPASCSPQLPFAFTPSNHSFTSGNDSQRRESGGFPLGMPAPSPPNKEPGALAVVRRPSWSNRSSSFENNASSGAPHNVVGYSVSPMLDSLEGSLFSSSTPKHGHQLPFSLPSTTSSPMAQQASAGSRSPEAGGVAASGGSVSSAYGPPRLTFPMDANLLASDETEGDSLPFALDREPSVPLPVHPAALQRGTSSTAGSMFGDTAMSGMEAEPDAAVGAFVRLIQEAPPLHRSEAGQEPSLGKRGSTPCSTEMSLQAGLDQLARLRMHLSTLHASTAGSTMHTPGREH